jgi:uracil-DNA glycosylase family 4
VLPSYRCDRDLERRLEPFPGLRALRDLYEAKAYSCTLCPRSRARKRVVFGVGWPERPHVLFASASPTLAQELSFDFLVGEQGELLRKGIDVLGLDSSKLYYLNVLCCRARWTATAVEVEACRPIAVEQVRAVRPACVFCMGDTAARSLLGSEVPAVEMRGRWHTMGETVPVRVSHSLKRVAEGGSAIKQEFWDDLRSITDPPKGTSNLIDS